AKRLVGPGGAIVVGQDTRRSGDMFVAAITAGATSLGVDVHRAGIVPTPALAYLAGSGEFAAGIMVSASHNPAEDNGLKVLDEPNGVNINVASGATHPGALAEAVAARAADVGFALDGDADRLIAADSTGAVVDGDQVLGILALDRLARGVLPKGGLVVSVLSNGGLQAAVEAAGGQVVRTP